jgi:GT2 family glycosyltransferase
MRSVTVVIVNYRAAELVLDNLPSLTAERQGVEKLDVIVVENGSDDGSEERLRRGMKEVAGVDAELVAASVNQGFAAGNNIGFARIEEKGERPDGVLLLNPDTRLPDGTIGRLIGAASTSPRPGVIGGRALKEDGRPAGCAFRFPTLQVEAASFPVLGKLMGKGASDIDVSRMSGPPVPCDWVSGSCFLITREALNAEPRFDQRYFLYFEETDYCRRIKAHGFDVLHTPEARYTHIGGQSTGVADGRAVTKDMPPFWYESYRRYYVQNHGPVYAAAIGSLRIMGLATRRLLGRPPAAGQPKEAGFWRHAVMPTLTGAPL